MRRAAKAINFGLMYGMSAFGLAKRLEVSRTQAQEYIDRYFERFNGVRGYMDDVRTFARTHGFVETVAGRRLYLPDIHSKNRALVQYAERAAINAPMQGTAADLIKQAMLAVSHEIAKSKLQCQLLMQVHDELVFEVHKSQLTEACALIKTHMENINPLSVPLIVEVGFGSNWDEAH
jgi:DNA polymerase-1